MSGRIGGIPWGIWIIKKFLPSSRLRQDKFIRIHNIVLTFIGYTLFVTTRRPITVVKSRFAESCHGVDTPTTNHTLGKGYCFWAPFQHERFDLMLAFMDAAFELAYGVSILISGILSDRVNPRYIILLGSLFNGYFTAMMSLAYFWSIDNYHYLLMIMIFSGASHSFHWPATIACLSKWYGKRRMRGTFFAVWCFSTSLGRILGIYMADNYVVTEWGYSFLVPAIIVTIMGIIEFFLLVTDPSDLDELESGRSIKFDFNLSSIDMEVPSWMRSSGAILFRTALKIPGVIEYSMCLFFLKMVKYTFFYWIPVYIQYSTTYGYRKNSLIPMALYVGGMIGSVTVGLLYDFTGCSAIICTCFMLLAFPAIYVLHYWSKTGNVWTEIFVKLFTGFTLEGPFTFITATISTLLGSHKSIGRDKRALSTVSSITSAFAAIGAASGAFALSPLLYSNICVVPHIMTVSNLLAILSLARITYREIRRRGKMERKGEEWISAADG